MHLHIRAKKLCVHSFLYINKLIISFSCLYEQSENKIWLMTDYFSSPKPTFITTAVICIRTWWGTCQRAYTAYVSMTLALNPGIDLNNYIGGCELKYWSSTERVHCKTWQMGLNHNNTEFTSDIFSFFSYFILIIFFPFFVCSII